MTNNTPKEAPADRGYAEGNQQFEAQSRHGAKQPGTIIRGPVISSNTPEVTAADRERIAAIVKGEAK